jgi:SAM-dependent methyltransferase
VSVHRRAEDASPQEDVVAACEDYLDRHSDCYLGVGWTKSQAEADTRYRVMLEAIRAGDPPVSLLDFGCGLSHLYEHILRTERRDLHYAGLDVSERFLQRSRAKSPRSTTTGSMCCVTGRRPCPCSTT